MDIFNGMGLDIPTELEDMKSFGLQINCGLVKNNNEYELGVNIDFTDEEKDSVKFSTQMTGNNLEFIFTSAMLDLMQQATNAQKEEAKQETTDDMALWDYVDSLEKQLKEKEANEAIIKELLKL